VAAEPADEDAAGACCRGRRRRVHHHPRGDANINVSVLQNQSMFDELRNTCARSRARWAGGCSRRRRRARADDQELLPDDSQVRLKRAIHAWRNRRQPTIVTHDLSTTPAIRSSSTCGNRGLFKRGRRSG
jgi:hypothetical protein